MLNTIMYMEFILVRIQTRCILGDSFYKVGWRSSDVKLDNTIFFITINIV
jgi:hypothetical protein